MISFFSIKLREHRISMVAPSAIKNIDMLQGVQKSSLDILSIIADTRQVRCSGEPPTSKARCRAGVIIINVFSKMSVH